MKILCLVAEKSSHSESMEETLKEMGHSVNIFCYRRKRKKFNFNYQIPLLYQISVYDSNNIIKKVVMDYQPDILITLKGEIIFPKTIEWIKKNFKIPCVLWSPDDPQLFYRFSRYIAPVYDYVFTSSVDVIPKYKQLGVKNVNYLPFFCDPSLHKIVKLTDEEKEKYQTDICFVGKFYPEREKILKFLLDYNITIYGPNWQFSDRELIRKWAGKAIFDEELIKLFNASKIVLNIHENQMKYGGMKANLRVFEATGCGTFHLTDKPKGIEDLFKPGVELVCYETKKELLQSLDYYLENSHERKKIAKAGQKRAYKDHTIKKRMEELLSVVE
jgi:spore maturation protein CgeB